MHARPLLWDADGVHSIHSTISPHSGLTRRTSEQLPPWRRPSIAQVTFPNASPFPDDSYCTSPQSAYPASSAPVYSASLVSPTLGSQIPFCCSEPEAPGLASYPPTPTMPGGFPVHRSSADVQHCHYPQQHEPSQPAASAPHCQRSRSTYSTRKPLCRSFSAPFCVCDDACSSPPSSPTATISFPSSPVDYKEVLPTPRLQRTASSAQFSSRPPTIHLTLSLPHLSSEPTACCPRSRSRSHARPKRLSLSSLASTPLLAAALIVGLSLLATRARTWQALAEVGLGMLIQATQEVRLYGTPST